VVGAVVEFAEEEEGVEPVEVVEVAEGGSIINNIQVVVVSRTADDKPHRTNLSPFSQMASRRALKQIHLQLQKLRTRVPQLHRFLLKSRRMNRNRLSGAAKK
jgi:hypothetical protein